MIVVVVIGILYVLLLLVLYLGMTKVKVYSSHVSGQDTYFSIVIAFRNEALHLPDLLSSLAKIDYPKDRFEILMVNDDSSDDSVAIIQQFFVTHPTLQWRVLSNHRQSVSPKKDAITTAVQHSKYPWILTTDADCTVPKTWLQAFDSLIHKENPKLIAGLVSYQEKKGFLFQFQNYDWMSLTGVTVGSFGWKKPLLCSGANLAYTKQAFIAQQGFTGNDTIASGDDVFLLHKMYKAYPGQVLLLNNTGSIVQTKSEQTWKELMQQRMRWAKKTTQISHTYLQIVGWIVFLTNITALILLFLILYRLDFVLIWIAYLFLKILVDTVFLLKVTQILGKKIILKYLVPAGMVYPFFSVGVVLVGFFKKIHWKGRRFSA